MKELLSLLVLLRINLFRFSLRTRKFGNFTLSFGNVLSVAWYNSFHVKAKNERFTAAGSRCRNNLKYENLTSSFGGLRRGFALGGVLRVQHDCFTSFNHLITKEFTVSFLKNQRLLPPPANRE